MIADGLKDESRALAKREAQVEQMQRDRANAPRLTDVVTMALKAGADPKYIAMRYGVDLERCERYVAALRAQEEKRREREVTARGDSETLEVGEISDGAGSA